MPSAPVVGSRRSSSTWSTGRVVARRPGSSTGGASWSTSCGCTLPADRLAEMILAIDQGTTGTTCLVFDEQAEPIGRAYREFAQHFPRPGWVDHDAREIWEVT